MADTEYFWVVLCKNHKFHKLQNLFFEHKIPLAETDPYSPPPNLNEGFLARCDDCGEEHKYKAKDLLRVEMEYPELFTTHPMFEPGASPVVAQSISEAVENPKPRKWWKQLF